MDLWQAILAIVGPLILGYLGWNERDKMVLKQKLEESREHMHKIDSQQQVLESQNDDMKDDLKRIEKKVDLLLDKLIQKSI
jgi:hypothetical protein